MKLPSILIVSGESSGEQCGAELVKSFERLESKARFFGVGGRTMRDAGVEMIADIKELSVVGLFETLSSLKRIYSLFRRLLKECKKRNPDAAVLIDSPDFNLRLAKKLFKRPAGFQSPRRPMS